MAHESDRQLIEAIRCTSDRRVMVDKDVMLDRYTEEPLWSLLETVEPQVHVNGPDYGAQETWAEWPVMERFHTDGYTIRNRNEISTSALVKKIRPQGEE